MPTDQHIKNAKQKFNSGRIREAFDELTLSNGKPIDINFTYGLFYQKLAETTCNQTDFDQAIKYYKHIIDTATFNDHKSAYTFVTGNPTTTSKAYLSAAKCLTDQGRLTEARRLYQRGYTKIPDFYEARANEAFLWALEGNCTIALSAYAAHRTKIMANKWSQRSKLPHPEYHFSLGEARVYRLQNQYQKALNKYHSLLKLQTNNPSANIYAEIAITYELIGNNQSAINCLKNGIMNHPKSINLKLTLARAYEKIGHISQAIQLYDHLVSSNSFNTQIGRNILHAKARLLENIKQYQSAYQLLTRIHKIEEQYKCHAVTLSLINCCAKIASAESIFEGEQLCDELLTKKTILPQDLSTCSHFYIKINKPEIALKIIKNALKKNQNLKKDKDINISLAHIYRGLNDYNNVQNIYTSLLSENYSNQATSEIQLDYAHHLMEVGNLAKAQQILTAIINNNPTLEEAQLSLAICHIDQGKNKVDVLLGLAKAYEGANALQSVASIYQLLHQIQPKHKKILLKFSEYVGQQSIKNMGFIMTNEQHNEFNHFDIAEKLLTQGTKQFPNNKNFKIWLARYYIDIGDINKGLVIFYGLNKRYNKDTNISQSIIGEYIGCRAAIIGYAIGLDKQKKHPQASWLLENYSSKLPDDHESQYSLGVLYKDNGDHYKALKIANKLLEIAPQSKKAHLLKGQCLLSLATHKSNEIHFHKNNNINSYKIDDFVTLAIEHFKNAQEIFPHDREIKLNLAICYRKAGEFSIAKKLFQEIIKQHPYYTKAWINYSILCWNKQEYKAAISSYQDAYEHLLSLPSSIATQQLRNIQIDRHKPIQRLGEKQQAKLALAETPYYSAESNAIIDQVQALFKCFMLYYNVNLFIYGGFPRDTLIKLKPGLQPGDIDLVLISTESIDNIKKMFEQYFNQHQHLIDTSKKILRINANSLWIDNVCFPYRIDIVIKSVNNKNDINLILQNFLQNCGSTISSLAIPLNPHHRHAKHLLDFNDGMYDLSLNLIRIPHADQKFQQSDKHILMLSILRQQAKLRYDNPRERQDFTIEKQTLDAIRKYNYRLLKLNGSHLYSEFEKFFTQGFAKNGFSILESEGMINLLAPNLYDSLQSSIYKNSYRKFLEDTLIKCETDYKIYKKVSKEFIASALFIIPLLDFIKKQDPQQKTQDSIEEFLNQDRVLLIPRIYHKNIRAFWCAAFGLKTECYNTLTSSFVARISISELDNVVNAIKNRKPVKLIDFPPKNLSTKPKPQSVKNKGYNEPKPADPEIVSILENNSLFKERNEKNKIKYYSVSQQKNNSTQKNKKLNSKPSSTSINQPKKTYKKNCRKITKIRMRKPNKQNDEKIFTMPDYKIKKIINIAAADKLKKTCSSYVTENSKQQALSIIKDWISKCHFSKESTRNEIENNLTWKLQDAIKKSIVQSPSCFRFAFWQTEYIIKLPNKNPLLEGQLNFPKNFGRC